GWGRALVRGGVRGLRPALPRRPLLVARAARAAPAVTGRRLRCVRRFPGGVFGGSGGRRPVVLRGGAGGGPRGSGGQALGVGVPSGAAFAGLAEDQAGAEAAPAGGADRHRLGPDAARWAHA